MQSKGKKTPTREEKEHIERIKGMRCALTRDPPPSECHEIEQGKWWTSIPLSADAHRGSFNGLHGQKRLWSVKKMDEMDALNDTVRRLMTGRDD